MNWDWIRRSFKELWGFYEWEFEISWVDKRSQVQRYSEIQTWFYTTDVPTINWALEAWARQTCTIKHIFPENGCSNIIWRPKLLRP